MFSFYLCPQSHGTSHLKREINFCVADNLSSLVVFHIDASVDIDEACNTVQAHA
jgi:hypothetical protein